MTLEALTTETFFLTLRWGPKACPVTLLLLGTETATRTGPGRPVTRRCLSYSPMPPPTTLCGALPTVESLSLSFRLGTATIFMFLLL